MKTGHLTSKPQPYQGFWGQMAIFSPTTPIYFSEDVKNQVRNLLRGRKVGVTDEKMGI